MMIALLLGLSLFSYHPAQAADAPLETSAPRPVISEHLSSNDLHQTGFAGTITSETETLLAFQTLGRIAERLVSVGDMVEAGALIATLDQTTLQEDVTAAEAARASALAQAETAANALSRSEELFSRGVAPQSRLDEARRAAVASTAAVAQADARLAAAQDAASFARLIAPSNGVVIAVHAEAGDIASAGTPIVTLADLTRREAIFDLPEPYLAALAPDQTFLISLPQSDLPPIEGQLRLIEPISDNAIRSRRIHITLPEAPNAFRIGSIVEGVVAREGGAALSLPRTAIIDGETPSVWRVTEGRKIERRSITLGGPAAEGRIFVLSGVNAGDEIITKGVNRLTDGQIVGDSLR